MIPQGKTNMHVQKKHGETLGFTCMVRVFHVYVSLQEGNH